MQRARERITEYWNASGAPVYSETVREPQLVITTPDPCDHYEATVTPMCGSITSVHTSPIHLGGTFDVVGVSVNTSSPMGLVCLFNTGSLARGCLVYLTDTDTGVYSVKVYDIERDGSVSSVPALAGEIVTVFGPSTVPSVDNGYIFTSCELSTRNGSSVIQGPSSNDRPFV
eukprot:Em0012g101a